MINIIRDPQIPDALSKNSFAGVKEALIKMQHYKCYLCESKESVTTHIEHFKPKSKEGAKFEWENLLLACDHCNSIKNYVADKIEGFELLDCTNFDTIITDEIAFYCGGMPREKVRIEPVISDGASKAVEDTVYLLNQIFNYNSESLAFDAKALTDEAIKEVKKLMDLIHEYEYESHTGAKKARMLSDMHDMLSIESPFTAFKIWYIKERYSKTEFIDLLPSFEE